MASVSPSPNSPPFSDPPLPPRLFPPPPTATQPSTSSPPSQSPPSTAPPPSSPPPPPSTVPPPSDPPSATTLPPSPPPVSSSPPVSSTPIPPTNSLPPSSPSPPTKSPPPSSPSPPTTSPPPSSPIPPARSPPPSSSSPPARSPPPSSSSPPARSPPPSSPSPPARSPPPSSASPPPPPSLNPPVISSPPPSNPPRNSPPPQASSPPPILPPPSILNPPPPRSPPTNSSTPPVITPPSTNSSPPVIVASPPPFRLPPPSPSQVLTSPPGNPNNNDSSPNRPSGDGGIGTGGIVGIGVVVSVVLLTVIIGACWCVIRRKKKLAGHNGPYVMPTSMGTSPASDSGLLKIQTENQPSNHFVYTPQEPGGLGNSRPKFTYEDLLEATNGFSVQNLLGSGGFGCVYKGCLADGTEVAVKELNIGGGQGEREFSAEVEIISRIHHRYLVSLVGYCISENKRLLVYEYVPNNTLYFHLHGSSGLVLDWATRVKVASGAARGIAYLHEDCHPRIIHRDIKSSNILLDINFEARVSDFGLARLAADANTHITTRVMGTFGYLAPEYASSGKLTEKSDVYSFGVVLLELITGRKPVDTSQPLGDESLVEWARPLLSHAVETEDFQGLVDPRLGTNFVAIEMFRMIEAAAACIRHSAAKRSRMAQIVRAFESMETEDLSNGMRVGESEIFNSAQQSAEIRLFQRMAFGSQDCSTDFFTQGSFAQNSNQR